jgi:hypothetical protein
MLYREDAEAAKLSPARRLFEPALQEGGINSDKPPNENPERLVAVDSFLLHRASRGAGPKPGALSVQLLSEAWSNTLPPETSFDGRANP